MKKIPIEREKSDARISSSEREEARPKVKILFLHGFFASGQCQPALALRKAFEGRAAVVSPDLPTHPKEALAQIRDVVDRERPDVLVGNSCGSFYAQMVAPVEDHGDRPLIVFRKDQRPVPMIALIETSLPKISPIIWRIAK